MYLIASVGPFVTRRRSRLSSTLRSGVMSLLPKLDLVYVRSMIFFFSSRRRHTRYWRGWSSDVCSSDLVRLANLYGVTGDQTPYGQTVTDAVIFEIMTELEASSDYRARRKAVAAWNGQNTILKDRKSVV